MDELSADELRGAAFAANLRRAFGAPAGGNVPDRFTVLLNRLSEVQPPSRPRRTEQHRLEA